MKDEFNNHDAALGDIEEALAELFDAEAILGNLVAGLSDEARAAVQRVFGMLGKASGLLDRPWPMIEVQHHAAA